MDSCISVESFMLAWLFSCFTMYMIVHFLYIKPLIKIINIRWMTNKGASYNIEDKKQKRGDNESKMG